MKKSPTELINLTFSALMVIITLAGFVVFMFTDLFSDRAQGEKRYILAVIFLAYSIYRGYRMYSAYNNDKNA